MDREEEASYLGLSFKPCVGHRSWYIPPAEIPPATFQAGNEMTSCKNVTHDTNWLNGFLKH